MSLVKSLMQRELGLGDAARIRFGRMCVCVSGIRYTAHPMWEDVKAESIMALPTVPDMSAG